MLRLYFLATPRLATPSCTAMDLFSALLAIEPGLLLEEKPAAAAGGLPGQGSLPPPGSPANSVPKTADPWSGASIEEEAAAAYAASRDCLRIPYDMPRWAQEARKAAYLETEREFSSELKRMAQEGKLSPAELSSLAAVEGSRRVYDELFSLSLARINRPSFIARLEAAEDARRALELSACARHPSLSSYAPRLGLIADVLARRRAAMAANVLAALGRSRADAAILVGAAEKGRLERAVAKGAATLGYAVANFWES